LAVRIQKTGGWMFIQPCFKEDERQIDIFPLDEYFPRKRYRVLLRGKMLFSGAANIHSHDQTEQEEKLTNDEDLDRIDA
jgi:hypothetical protein